MSKKRAKIIFEDFLRGIRTGFPPGMRRRVRLPATWHHERRAPRSETRIRIQIPLPPLSGEEDAGEEAMGESEGRQGSMPIPESRKII